MAITAVQVTRITCDGTPKSVCPSQAEISFQMPQMRAIRAALAKGWNTDGLTICPLCQLAEKGKETLAVVTGIMRVVTADLGTRHLRAS